MSVLQHHNETNFPFLLQHQFNVALQIKCMTSKIKTEPRNLYILLSNVADLKTKFYNFGITEFT